MATSSKRIIFKPIEKCIIYNHDYSQKVIEEDNFFKPGFLNMLNCFLSGEMELFCSVEEQIKYIEFYKNLQKINNEIHLNKS